MIYRLKNCKNGKRARYYTTVEIVDKGEELTFKFVADRCKYNCPNPYYNGFHCEGDACEIFIGTDPDKKVYYEIEVSPLNDLMIAKITHKGIDKKKQPIIGVELIKENFVKSNVVAMDDGYVMEISFKKEKVFTGNGELFFNVYRLETDGEKMEKHLFALSPTMKKKFHVIESFVCVKDYAN